MKTSDSENNSFLINIMTLLGLVAGVFLIIFFKQRKSKQNEHYSPERNLEEGRVQISPTKMEKSYDLNERQKKILEAIQKKGTLEPSEIYKMIPNVSTRTLRRDMDVLVKNNLVQQKGSTKSTTYIYTG